MSNETVMCRWFLRCDRPATGTTAHPILGNVPTCDRCAARAAGRDLPASIPEEED